MAVTVLTGLVDTADVLSNELVVDMSEDIAMLHADDDQFTTMLMKLPKRNASREQVNWLEDQLLPRYTTVATSALAAATTLVVAAGTGAYFRANDVVFVARTGEKFKVTSIATDTLTIARGLGGTAAANINVADDLIIVYNATAQGGTLGTALITKKVLGFNYVGIVRTPFRFTNTNLWVNRYGPEEPGREGGKKLVEHRRQIEYSVFWGPRAFDTSGANPIGYSGGLDEFLTSNLHTAIGTLTNTNVDTFLRQDLQNTRQPAIFAAPIVQQAVSNFLRSIWNPPNAPDERVYGAKVDYWLSGAYGGKTPIFVKRDWNDFATGSNQAGGRAYVVDLANIKLRPAPGDQVGPRFAALLKDRQARDADEQAMELLSEYSVEIRQQSHFARWSGVTG